MTLPSFLRIDVYGWISQEGFSNWHKIQDFGCGGREVAEATGLNPAFDLISGEHLGNQMREENSF